jgi:hypothetical protein
MHHPGGAGYGRLTAQFRRRGDADSQAWSLGHGGARQETKGSGWQIRRGGSAGPDLASPNQQAGTKRPDQAVLTNQVLATWFEQAGLSNWFEQLVSSNRFRATGFEQ